MGLTWVFFRLPSSRSAPNGFTWPEIMAVPMAVDASDTKADGPVFCAHVHLRR
jgi:hypothetical protein